VVAHVAAAAGSRDVLCLWDPWGGASCPLDQNFWLFGLKLLAGGETCAQRQDFCLLRGVGQESTSSCPEGWTGQPYKSAPIHPQVLAVVRTG
jgi:hypothetical protein